MVFLTPVNAVRNRGPHRFWKRAMYRRLAWHFFGRKRNCYSISIRYVHRALRYSTWGRRLKKADAKEADISLNRKVLADIAIYEPRTFKSLTELAKQHHKEMGFTPKGLDGPPPGIILRTML
ncbi:39S ribosomal protein L20, mitochondrial isoform X2 [Octopus bimaculoides]|uniref:39S ribosomal protein L20, mitochondrial n=1 Tax=Octopus bimaculoides TaxID=37653 RepID=A0A0L8I759_OCTBM|nr:39S ribosomal protein L20, mitochondrial isoform X2 [Octopus bimaculoides]|eukprot:XP_014790553.1 PREDICTED: 39S ribosomal protein L20, mitochondrial-like isoform X2 [Octopus bimaculoides]